MGPLERLGADDVARAMSSYRDVLRLHQDAVNRLNVYPVPDGDTGTNMALTLESVVAEIDQARQAEAAQLSLPGVCRAVAHGSLMGARGNSGVILSQLLRGLTGVMSRRHGEGDGPDGAVMAQALVEASEAARQAVLRPVEGTILSVARAAGEGASAGTGSTLLEVLERSHAAASEALARTPEQLPVLASAGVVDAGGTGYLLLLDALLHVVDGRPLPPAPDPGEVSAAVGPDSIPWAPDDGYEVVEGGLRYEVMYLLDAPDETMAAFRDVWAGIGDSIVVVGGDGLWNCHIHTNDVGAAVEAALDVGRPRNIRVTDLAEQVEEERWVREGASAEAPPEPTGPVPRTAVVAVANGDGVRRIFRSLGVHHIVAGGQSMNPSTAQILEVVESVPSPEVVLLPNNDNIRPVAMQVCDMASKPVRMVGSSGIVEGFAALLEYDPQASADENAERMAQSARRIVAGEVTQAVRDASGPAGPIHAGDWMGLSRDGVEVVCDSLVDATCGLLAKLLRDDHEILTLIEGEGAAVNDTRRINEWAAEHRPDLLVEVHHGGQPLYPYLISIE